MQEVVGSRFAFFTKIFDNFCRFYRIYLEKLNWFCSIQKNLNINVKVQLLVHFLGQINRILSVASFLSKI